jgi:hypothetical protein
VETFPANHESYKDYERTLKFAYLYSKTVTLIPSHNERTNAVMLRNRRIGCSMSGIIQAIEKFGRHQFFRWCDQGYNYIQTLDQIYSDWLCIPRSIKTCCVKPSGSVSLLTGSTPGIHYPHSEYYIRNIRVQNTSPLVDVCRDAGYHVEPCVYSPDTSVVSFPVKEKFYRRGKKDVSIWQQFANASDMQKWWADNMVSATVSFQDFESEQVKDCLEFFQDKLKGVSLLPLTEHGYEQAPYIEITKAEYERMTSEVTPMNFSGDTHELDDKFCNGDKCELPMMASK